MPKIGRNALCPCSSGEKYKKDQGSLPSLPPTQSLEKPIATFPRGATSAHVDLPGLPGILYYMTLRPFYKDQGDSRNTGGIQGLPGSYKVVFTLNRPGFSLLPEYSDHFGGDLKGDSHLSFIPSPGQKPNNAMELRIETECEYGHFIFRLIPNEQGFVSRIQVDSLQAENFKDAELKAYQAISPELSNFSALFDIPMHIYQVDVIEIRTGMMIIGKVSPFQEIIVSGSLSHALPVDYRKYASFYREAVNCNSHNYQFLCFYKLIDGLLERRGRIMREAKEKGEEIPSVPREFVPILPEDQEAWFNSLFPTKRKLEETDRLSIFPEDVVSRNIYDIIDKELRQVRNRIAHSILDSGEDAVLIDNSRGIQELYKWLPLTKCLARHLLIREFPEVFEHVIHDAHTEG